MSIIPLPDNLLRSANWNLVDPAQVNRSEFAGGRQVIGDNQAPYWTASADHVPIVGEENIRAWRSFFTRLRGPVNTFLLPSTENRQATRDFYHLKPFQPLVSAPNCTVSSDGRDITRVLAGGSWGAAYAYTNTVSGGARVSFRTETSAGEFMVSLGTNISGASGYTGLQNAWRWGAGLPLQIYRGGVLTASYTGTTNNDVASILYDDVNDVVVFLRNGEVMAQFSVASGASYRAEAQIYNTATTVRDLSFGGLSGVAAGATSLDMAGPAGTQEAAVSEGMFATAIFEDGGSQLVVITADAAVDGSGNVTVSFEPMLRGKPLAFLWGAPWCQMAMDDPALGYSVAPGQEYGFGFSCTEAF